jgi:radical SAM protein with 4Fe4S-binding SPASM domain
MQRFLAVIDSHGYVFPCPQITTNKFRRIAYGNVHDMGFWEVWNSKRRRRIIDMEVDKMGCRICDRKDEALNVELGAIFEHERVS